MMPANHHTGSQGAWIPDELNLNMLPELPMLTRSMDPGEWCHPSNEEYENWLCWSALVYDWLYSNMERDIQDMIDNMSDRPENLLADWLYNAINTMRNNHNVTDAANLWRKWCSLHRTNYPSAVAYITAYRTQFDIIRKLNQAPSCFNALWDLLQNLTNELPEARCAIGYLTLSRSPGNLDYNTFVAHCDHMISKSNKPGLVFSNTLPDKDTPPPRNSKRRRC
ncbi:hypothetical protein N7463_010472 [Penicillium fimorum]|uniref:Uncharacterized protein n=1 Tax=Penicillium fimorum TaxID=1882269 RepID=A0A9W9XKR7_9EURO|nr:hypothetical protein N7463_010472 [Penicillium fimorum]